MHGWLEHLDQWLHSVSTFINPVTLLRIKTFLEMCWVCLLFPVLSVHSSPSCSGVQVGHFFHGVPPFFFMFFVLSFLTHRLCCFQAFLCSLQFSLNCSQCYYIVVPAGLYFSPSDTMFELRHYEVFVCWHGGEVFWWIWRPGDPGCYWRWK